MRSIDADWNRLAQLRAQHYGATLEKSFAEAANYNHVADPSLDDVSSVINQEIISGSYAEEDIAALVILKSGEFGFFDGGCDTTGRWFHSAKDPSFYNLLITKVPQAIRERLGFYVQDPAPGI